MDWIWYALTALVLLLTVGTFAWQTPWIGVFGSVGGHLPGCLIALSAVGVVGGATTWAFTGSVGSLVAAICCVIGVVGGVVIVVDQRRALRSVGIEPTIADFFRPYSSAKAGHDEVVTYGPVDGYEPRMGVYRPAAAVAPFPVVVHVHGGGWSDGNEASDSRFCRILAEAGFLVFTPTYTLATPERPTWELAPRQIAHAIATASGLARRYGGAPGRVFLTGSSAGGHLAPLVANRVAAGDTFGVEGMPEIAALAVAIPAFDPALAAGNPFAIAGPTARRLAAGFTGGSPEEFPERYDAASATRYLSPQSPPISIVYGPNDWLVPAQATHSYAIRARSLGVEVEAFAVPWTGHLLGLSGAGGRAVGRLAVRWFQAHAVPTKNARLDENA